jgi:WS/DGAT/MGAT family acyltransferase
MRQLSGSDNIFLISESKNVYNHVAMMMIYDVSTAPDGKVRFKDILRHFEARLYQHPIFRRRLAWAPLGLDRPYWIEEKDIDLEYHIRHIALPKPGDWRQLTIQIARLHSRPLDRSRPLWEVYVIEGLDNIPKLPQGSFALFVKLHHASVDGMAGIHLAQALHALTPDTADAGSRHQPVYVDRDPSPIEFLTRAVGHAYERVLAVGKLGTKVAGKVIELGSEQVSRAYRENSLGTLTEQLASARAPQTRFNQGISAHRVFDGFGIPLSRIKRVRDKISGATLNDIFLAVAGGGVRNYLQSKGELPERSLQALMPMSLRTDASDGGNAVGAAMVRVCSDIADPLQRLKAAHHAAQEGKENAEKLGADLFSRLMDAVPSVVGHLILSKVMIPTVNMTVSNVRGPDQPLYMAGAKAMCFYPVSVPTDGCGLNLTGVSYNRVMWLSMVSCRQMVPDPAFFVACMKESWEELLAAADALPSPEAKAEPVPAPKKPATRARAAAQPAAAPLRKARTPKPKAK